MGDLFDIANLITNVGVDAVKIKSEPGLREKSSNEILTELFSTFDAGNIIDNDDESGDSKEDEDSPIKKKKIKKKHKHKDKKHKKKSKRGNSSDSSSDEGGRKKKKHKKKSKRKHAESDKSSDTDEPMNKIIKLENSDNFDIMGKSDALQENNKDSEAETNNREPSPDLPPSPFENPAILEDAVVPSALDKPKTFTHGKILIKDLKNSVVFSETVKEIENKKKAKEARMEDGELSESGSDENQTPSLSPSPGADERLSPIPEMDDLPNSQHEMINNDLRAMLKEKEKRKLESGSDSRKSRDKERSRRSKEKEVRKERRRSDSSSFTSWGRTSRESSRDARGEKSRDRHVRGRSYDRKDRDRDRESRRYDRSDRSRRRSLSKDRRGRYSRGRSRSKERKERIEIDKKKLLEIARKNAINMIKHGCLPLAQQDKAIATIQAGGKSIEELTDYCKSLSKSEAMGELSSISSDEDGSEKGFHHPFLLKERPPCSIIMNIRDYKRLPTKTFQEKTTDSGQLRLQFPVSSGQSHRKTESQWVPVSPKKPQEAPKKSTLAIKAPTKPLAIMPAPVPPPGQELTPVVAPVPPVAESSVFPQPEAAENIDIGSIVSQRLSAMRKLRENPNDVEALGVMYKAQTEMRTWAESKQMPGQFTGSTDVKILTPAQLTSGYQAWARRDQLVTAQPLSSGMGMTLLQKMGWRPGEGLGKNKEGSLEPLLLQVKLDKRGLVSDEDVGVVQRSSGGRPPKPVIPTVKTLEGKHPVSLLGEYCSKKKVGSPVYELCFECGPDHKKNFVFKVKVNGVEYKPSVASPNKKQAKAEAAQICLQQLGLLPT